MQPSRDRVEVVNFSRRGVYLVICGVLPHFMQGMYGYVRVVPCPGCCMRALDRATLRA